jgi:DNA-binding CsgD family transcriptional regulator
MISERRFNALVSAIYDAGADFGRWPDVMSLMAQAFHAPAVLFGGNGSRLEDVFVISSQVDAAQNERYVSYYHRINPIIPYILSSPVGVVKTDTMMIPKREFSRTEIYNDFLLPQDHGSMLGAVLEVAGSRQLSIVAQRRREFDRGDISLYRRLLPHLQRAVQLNLKLEQLNMQRAASMEMLLQLGRGAFLVDGSARVLLANKDAEQLTTPDGGLRIVNGVLRARSSPETAKLHRLVAHCEKSGVGTEETNFFLLSRGSHRPPLTVSVLPFRQENTLLLSQRPAAIVFTSDPDRAVAPPAARIKLRFGLTPAETAFALEIIKGDGVQACADRLGISRATARTHLAHIFRKAGVKRQAELVSLLSRP